MKNFAMIMLFVSGALLHGCARREAQAAVSQAAAETLTVRGDRLFVSVRVNGVEAEALLDSAAELSLLDDDFARRLGLQTANPNGETAKGTGGESDVSFADGVSIEAAGATLAGRTVAVLDLADISARLVGAPLDMVLGREFFSSGRVFIDVEKGRIRTLLRDSEPSGVRLELKESRGLETMPISIEGGPPVEAEFDLGNGSGMLIGAGYAKQEGLDAPERIIGVRKGGGVGGEVTRKVVRLKDVEIAGAHFTDVVAAIDETETASEANVGVGLLRNFVMTIDFPQSAVWLEPRR